MLNPDQFGLGPIERSESTVFGEPHHEARADFTAKNGKSYRVSGYLRGGSGAVRAESLDDGLRSAGSMNFWGGRVQTMDVYRKRERRKGLNTAMWSVARELHPDLRLQASSLLPDGERFTRSLPQDQQPPEWQEKQT